MALSGFAGIGDITPQPVSGVVGGNAYGEPGGVVAGQWLGGALPQIQRTTATGATSSTTYVLTCTIYGVTETASYTSDGSATTTEIAAGLAAAVQALPHFGSFVSVDYPGAALFDSTGPVGVAFTLTDASSDISQSVTQAAAAGSDVTPGTFVVIDPLKPLFPAPTFAPASTLTAGTALLTMTYGSGTVYTAVITVAGLVYTANHVGATDLATTRTAFIAAINAAMPADTVLAAAGVGAGEIDLTAEINGLGFVADVSVHTGSGTLALTSTSGLPTDDVSNVFGGFVAWAEVQDQVLDVNSIVFAPGSVIGVKARGTVYLAATVTTPSGIWINTTTGAVATSGGAGLVPLPVSLAVIQGPAPEGTGLAVARLTAQNLIPA